MSEELWWETRLEAWSREGFNVDSFRSKLLGEPALASELLIQFENIVIRNRNLRRRVIDSSISNSRKGKWLERLDQLGDSDALLDEWERDAARERPWEPFAHRAMPAWRERSRGRDLEKLVKRLEALDRSSIPATQPLLVLFDDVDAEQSISELIADIELDEARRTKIIGEMIELLSSEGIDGSRALKMDISTALDYLTELQTKSDLQRSNRLRIDQDIRPYDSELADRLLGKRELVPDEISAIISNLDERLKLINNNIQEWRGMGIIFPHDDRIRRTELLDWEASLPDVEKAIEIHLRAKERWDDFKMLWPDKTPNNSLVGHLDHTEEFVDLVDALDQEWREFELEGMSLVETWEDRGFAMDVWRLRVSEEPRGAIKWLKLEQKRYSLASDLIDLILSMDTSLGGEDEAMRRIAILREFELDDGILEEMSDYVEVCGRRAARHRSMLESEWMEILGKSSVEDVNTANLSLADFEELIAASRLKRKKSGVPINRLIGKMREEIDSWHRQGFAIDVVSKMLDEAPMSLALRIANIREAISNHSRLRKRLSALEWKRDPELSVVINLDLARPDRLEGLNSSIPQLAEDLSTKDVIDEHFNFIPWQPKSVNRPILMPASQTNVDDTMEAILEEMESVSPIIVEASKEIAINEDEDIEEALIGGEDEVIPTPEPVTIPEKIIIENNEAICLLLRSIGLSSEADMFEEDGDISKVRRVIAPHVGIQPRDLRVDRLLRLSLRLLPNGDDDDVHRLALLSILAEHASAISGWTRKRLDARHKSATGSLLDDAVVLGEALDRIPGPGTTMPLDADDLQLPSPSDLDGLKSSVEVLGRRVLLPTSGGVR
ncbi:MAG: hypothetical protein QGI21_06755 [Candidatus Poseidoniaceae archaeon]|jgi:hypothetical protein|nr:hypothetical protein [Candidatus Poseidoniaceae archaeon]